MKRLESQSLPAITVCILNRFELSKLSELSETNKNLYQDYMRLVNQSIDNGTFTEDVKDKLADIYREIQENNINKTVNLDQLFDLGLTNKSIEVIIGGQYKSLVNQSFIQLLDDSGKIHQFQINEKPIYSFAKTHEQGFDGIICFTYFSALKEYWNSFLFDLKNIQINLLNTFTHYPPIYKRNYQVAIHSPNIMQKVSQLD